MRTLVLCVVVTAACSAPDPVTTVEQASTSARAWEPRPGTPQPRFEGRYERLHDGRVIAMGGDTGYFTFDGQASVEAWDPRTGTWSDLEDLPVPLDWFFSAVLQDGRVLVWGSAVGFASHADSFLYDPRTNHWTATGPYPVGVSNTHSFEDGVTLDDGHVLSAGGFTHWGEADEAVLAAAFLFDPRTLTWAPTGSMSSERGTANVVRLPDGRVLHAGGLGPEPCCVTTATADVYEPRAHRWVRVPDMPPVRTDDGTDYVEKQNLLNPGSRWQACAGVVDGKVILAGGSTFGGDTSVIRSSALEYDPARNRWREVAPMRAPRDGCRSGVDDGALVVAGAGDFDVAWLQSTEVYRGHAWHDGGAFTTDPGVTPFGGAIVPVRNGLLLFAGVRRTSAGDLEAASDAAFLFAPRGW